MVDDPILMEWRSMARQATRDGIYTMTEMNPKRLNCSKLRHGAACRRYCGDFRNKENAEHAWQVEARQAAHTRTLRLDASKMM
jgi:hypothetical protein